MLFRFLILVHVCAAFPLKCPEPAQWSTRARGFCPDPSKYFCLKNDLINGYSENCTIFDFLQPGRKHVLRGGLDADICSSERYQPWPITFYTNVSTNCIFLKSACNEEGQVVYGNGNRNTDITCRCDYTRGYDFLNKPQNLCFCEPSKEDCSCFLKTCHKATDKLSSDYECHQEDKNLTVSECEEIIYQRVNTTRNKYIMEYISMREKNSNTDKKGRRKCNNCENMSVYNCYDCNTVLCEDCFRKHKYESKNQGHLIQLISNSFILNFKFIVTPSFGFDSIRDIKYLPNGEIIVSLKKKEEVKIYSVVGIQRRVIQLEKTPLKMTVVDKNTVAVLLEKDIVAIIDIQQNHVQYLRNNAMPYGSDISLIYIENEFYIGNQHYIAVIDMSGSVKRRITLSFTPYDMCYDVDSQRIYCIDREHSQLICIDRDGNDLFTFTDPSMTNLEDLTIDNEGNVLVLCIKDDDNSGYVIKVDSNGENSEEVITNISTPHLNYPRICYDHLTNSVVIGLDNKVYIYKKK